MGHGSLLRLGPAMAHFLEKEKPKLSALADTAIKPMDLDAKSDGRGGLEDNESSEPHLMQSTTTVKEDNGRMDECGGNDIVSTVVSLYGQALLQGCDPRVSKGCICTNGYLPHKPKHQHS